MSKRIHFIKGLKPGNLVLDIGCGTGSILEKLSENGYNAFGVDSSRKMLIQMQKKKLNRGICGTSINLPFRDSTFDLVITVATFHHIADALSVRKTIGEMVRVVKSGGAIVIWDHNKNNPYWPFLMSRLPQDSGAERLIPAKEIINCLKKVKGVRSIKHYYSGFVADFVPNKLLSFAKMSEKFLESIPIVRNFSAHNVIVAFKGR